MPSQPSSAPGGPSFASMPAVDELEADRLFAELQDTMFGRSDPVRVGRYALTRRLGQGAMGVVYEAEDPNLDRTVALKVLHPSLRQRDAHRGHGQIRREAQTLGQVRHPNVVQVFDVGEADGRVYLAMELVAGRSLDRWLSQDRPTPSTIVEHFVQAGRGLQAAHDVGVIHRDFKPSNVQVGDDGRVRVLDFGLATPRTPLVGHSSVGAQGDASVAGTPHYMAPELLEGSKASPNTDQYAFCVALGEALTTGHRSVPRWLQRILDRGTSQEPSARYASVAALVDALQSPPRRGHQMASIVAAIAAVCGLGWAAFASARSEPLQLGPLPLLESLSTVGSQAEHARIRAKSDRVWALVGKGQLDASIAMGRDAVGDAVASGDGGLQATTRVALGMALAETGDVQSAATELEAAHGLAVTHRRRGVRFSAATQLATIEFQRRNDVEAGTRWLRDASSLRPHSPRESFALAQLELAAARAAGDPQAATRAAQRAVDTADEAFGPSQLLALAHQGLATALHDEDRFSEARDAALEGLRVAQGSLPETDRAFEYLYQTLSVINASHARATGDTTLTLHATQWSQRFVDAVSRRLGPEHIATARAEANAAVLLGQTGDRRAAAEALTRATEKMERLGEADDPQLAVMVGNLGLLEADLGNLHEAERLLERSLIVLESAQRHRGRVLRFLDHLASVQGELGDASGSAATEARRARLMDE